MRIAVLGAVAKMIEGMTVDEVAERILKERKYLGRTYYNEGKKLTCYVSVDKFSSIYDIFYDDLSTRIWPYPRVEYKEMIDAFNKATKPKSFTEGGGLIVAPTSIDGRRVGPFLRKIKSDGRDSVGRYNVFEVRLNDFYFWKRGIFALSKEKRLIDFLKYVEKVYEETMKNQ